MGIRVPYLAKWLEFASLGPDVDVHLTNSYFPLIHYFFIWFTTESNLIVLTIKTWCFVALMLKKILRQVCSWKVFACMFRCSCVNQQRHIRSITIMSYERLTDYSSVQPYTVAADVQIYQLNISVIHMSFFLLWLLTLSVNTDLLGFWNHLVFQHILVMVLRQWIPLT